MHLKKPIYLFFILGILSFITEIQAQDSVLSSDDIYKIEVTKTGIYKIDYNYLKQLDGLNINSIDPRKIAIYGNGGGMLPELNSDSRHNDLEENPIKIIGGEDGSFDQGDYILFYAEGVKNNRYDSNINTYFTEEHIYSNTNSYYLKIKNSKGKRIEEQSKTSSEYLSTSTEKVQTYNYDKVNLLGEYFSTHGSGRTWYGESFSNSNTTNSFGSKFNFDHIILTEEIEYETVVAGRSKASSQIKVTVDQESFNVTTSSVTKHDSYSLYARDKKHQSSFKINSRTPKIEYTLQSNGKVTNMWLDYIKIISQHTTTYSGNPLVLQDRKSIPYSTSSYHISNWSNNLMVWNITNPIVVTHANVSNGTFHYGTDQTLQRFVVFDPNNTSNAPTATKIDNQNLHNTPHLDMLIIYHKEFKSEAERLAQHRRDYNDMKVTTVDIEMVYNEFSSGKCDPTAIRDYTRYLKLKFPNIRYLLLFGDGSYDYRGLNKGLANHNFIPSYQTKESLAPIKAIPSDDYYALLDPDEGENLVGALDIAIGRLPANTIEKAKIYVDKIINYETNPETLGEWRLNITFAADDEEKSGGHSTQAENISKRILKAEPGYNQDKIYIDAYPQVSSPGGDRYPAANQAINNNMYKGQLLYNYLGHGGPTGWAQERVLKIGDIHQWKNANKLCVMVTATCSFAGYDDPAITTAGEAVLGQPDGGAVALLTTTRAVYGSSNERLAKQVFIHAFQRKENQLLGIGEVLMLSKNSNASDTTEINARKFTLLGDPAMKLAIPQYKIRTNSINGRTILTDSIGALINDTIQSLSVVKVEGDILNYDGSILTDFNGTIIPTVYDKPTELSTLINDNIGSKLKFKVQQNILFKGAASVVNGHFSYEFLMPKDIKFKYGPGKISHYAHDGVSRDAMGYYDKVIIGGTDSTKYTDDQGPIIRAFMNDNSFAYGGYTDANPILYLELEDKSGINVTGSSIGHNITAVLDDQLNKTFVMNSYYKSAKDDYSKGTVSFPLHKLPSGKHSIKIKAWDLLNNSSETIIEFVVVNDSDKELHHVMNYPNPFVNKTNFRFEHGLPNNNLEILCHIFSVNGKLVKTIEKEQYTTSQNIDNLSWDGRDDYGQQLAKGTYFYKIKVSAEDQNSDKKFIKESNFEKLVILK